jgi:hypothetical protein
MQSNQSRNYLKYETLVSEKMGVVAKETFLVEFIVVKGIFILELWRDQFRAKKFLFLLFILQKSQGVFDFIELCLRSNSCYGRYVTTSFIFTLFLRGKFKLEITSVVKTKDRVWYMIWPQNYLFKSLLIFWKP